MKTLKSRALATLSVGIVSLLTAGLADSPAAAMLYGSNEFTDQLMRINTSTGIGTAVGAFGFDSVFGLAYDTLRGVVWGSDTATDQLLSIDLNTGIGSAIGAPGFGGITGLAYDSVHDIVYGSDVQTAQLVRISPTTGAGTAVGLTGNPIRGLAYNPLTETLYGSSVGTFYTINTNTGIAFAVGPTGFGNIDALAFDVATGILYGADNGEVSSQLITINTSTGVGTAVGIIGSVRVQGMTMVPEPCASLLLLGTAFAWATGRKRS